MNILMVGSWHLGSVIGACLAEQNHDVTYWDQNPKVSEKWSKGTPPIHEPGLDDLSKKHWGKGLKWAKDLKSASNGADWICLTYDTPITEKDEVLLESVEEGFETVLKAGFQNDANFFFTSQLPVGTSRKFLKKVLKANSNWKGHVFYQPENLRLGEAVKSFQAPDRMVLGLDDFAMKESLVAEYRTFVGNSTTPLNVMSLESAEMVKHALNSFLATCVVFANELSEICEETGANAWDVVASLKQDSRVGPKAFLRPGLGFAGGTLARDVKTLSNLSHRDFSHNFFAHLYQINQIRNDWVVDQLVDRLGSLEKKKIVLLGVTYKPGTSTVRRSPALEIGRLLVRLGARCAAIDPMADLKELEPQERANLSFTLETDANAAFKDADAAVVITEWPQFKELDWRKIEKSMKTPLLIDTKSLFVGKDASLIAGFNHIVPGMGEVL